MEKEKRYTQKKPTQNGLAELLKNELFISPPKDFELEKVVIGQLLQYKNCQEEFFISYEEIGKELFFLPENRDVIESILSLYRESSSIDFFTVVDKIRSQHNPQNHFKIISQLDIVGRERGVITGASFKQHCKILDNYRKRRQLILQFYEGLALVQDPEKLTEEIIEEQSAKLFSLSAGANKADDITVEGRSKTLFRVSGNITNPNDSALRKCGISIIDRVYGGLRKKELLTIGARTSMGKTALIKSMSENMAILGVNDVITPWLIFSLDMGKDQLWERYIAYLAGIDLEKFTKKIPLTEDEVYREKEARFKIEKSKLFIVDDVRNLTSIHATIKRAKDMHGIEVVAIDHYTKVRVPGTRDIRERVSAVTGTLKDVSVEEDIQVIGLSQINRSVENRSDKRPTLADLKESGTIEEDSDGVMLIYRPEHYNIKVWEDDKTPTAGTAEIQIDKMRNGRTATLRLQYIGNYTRFEGFEGYSPPVEAFPGKLRPRNYAEIQYPNDDVPF